VINEFQFLNEKERLKIINYLDSFYADIDKHNTLVEKFFSECNSF